MGRIICDGFYGGIIHMVYVNKPNLNELHQQ